MKQRVHAPNLPIISNISKTNSLPPSTDNKQLDCAQILGLSTVNVYGYDRIAYRCLTVSSPYHDSKLRLVAAACMYPPRCYHSNFSILTCTYLATEGKLMAALGDFP